MTAPEYRHLVETSTGTRHARLYDGTDAADAMAAWSRAVSDGAEYVILESLMSPRPPDPVPEDERITITVQHGSKMARHDGFAVHCHAVRPDHLGVPRTDS